MKRFTASLLAFMFIFLCACNQSGTEEQTGEDATIEITTREPATLPPEATTADSLQVEELEPAKILTVYFSHFDPIESVAEYISEKTEGGICKIETVKVYSENEKEFLLTAADEHERNARPALKNAPADLLAYDIIFLCFPSWDGTMPMALCTFIEDYDMRDMAVIPVMYGTENELKQATADIHSLVTSMMLINGFQFTSDFTAVQQEFDSWLNTVLYG